MRYVSTRGEAPPLGFVEATLAGLARDGGLYVPATWPELDARHVDFQRAADFMEQCAVSAADVEHAPDRFRIAPQSIQNGPLIS